MSEHNVRSGYYGLAVLWYLFLFAVVSFLLYGLGYVLVFSVAEFSGANGIDSFAQWWGPVLVISVGIAWFLIFRRKE